jgi:4-hydroxyphenylpyruvate dioxygenase
MNVMEMGVLNFRLTNRGRKKSQIEEYLDFYGGPEIHILPSQLMIIKTISQLKLEGRIFICSTSFTIRQFQNRTI